MTAQANKAFKIIRLIFLSLIVGRSLYSCVFTPVVLPPALLTPTTPPAEYQVAVPAVADHLRVVTLEPALLKQGRFSLTLFDETTHVALVDRVEEQRNGSFTWIGHLEGQHDSLVKVTVQDQVISGVVVLGQAHYELQPLQDNLYAFYERSTTA